MKVTLSSYIKKILISSNLKILYHPNNFKNTLIKEFPDKIKKIELLHFGLLKNIPLSFIHNFQFYKNPNLSDLNRCAYPRYYSKGLSLEMFSYIFDSSYRDYYVKSFSEIVDDYLQYKKTLSERLIEENKYSSIQIYWMITYWTWLVGEILKTHWTRINKEIDLFHIPDYIFDKELLHFFEPESLYNKIVSKYKNNLLQEITVYKLINRVKELDISFKQYPQVKLSTYYIFKNLETLKISKRCIYFNKNNFSSYPKLISVTLEDCEFDLNFIVKLNKAYPNLILNGIKCSDSNSSYFQWWQNLSYETRRNLLTNLNIDLDRTLNLHEIYQGNILLDLKLIKRILKRNRLVLDEAPIVILETFPFVTNLIIEDDYKETIGCVDVFKKTPKISRLHIKDAYLLTSLQKIVEYLPNLKTLECTGEKLHSLEINEYHFSLERLIIKSVEASDLSSIIFFPNIKYLEISNFNIYKRSISYSDISYISKLKKIETLICRENNILSIDFLQNCTNLKKVDLTDTIVKDLNPEKISRCKKLCRVIGLTMHEIQDPHFIDVIKTFINGKKEIQKVSARKLGLSIVPEQVIKSEEYYKIEKRMNEYDMTIGESYFQTIKYDPYYDVYVFYDEENNIDIVFEEIFNEDKTIQKIEILGLPVYDHPGILNVSQERNNKLQMEYILDE